MKKSILFCAICSLFMIACSKDDDKEVKDVVDLSILEEVKYWSIDSIVHWYNGQRDIESVEGISIIYKFDNNQMIYKWYQDHLYLDTTNYEIVNNQINFYNNENYWKIELAEYNKTNIKLKFTRDNSSARVASDSILEYYSASTKASFDAIGVEE